VRLGGGVVDDRVAHASDDQQLQPGEAGVREAGKGTCSRRVTRMSNVARAVARAPSRGSGW
jgi:hypothetical protein